MERRGLEVDVPGSTGARLAGRIDLPAGEPRAFAMFAHCFTCTKDFRAPARIGRALAERGLAVLRFDFTGLGGSGGELAETGFSSNVEDVVAAAAFLRTSYRAPLLLIGHSLGGAAVLAAASRVPEARAVVTIAAPSRLAHLRRLVAPVAAEIEARGAAEVLVAGRPFVLGRAFVEDIDRHGVEDLVGGLHAALLLLHAPDDEVVSVESARELFEGAPGTRSFVALEGVDHLVARREDAEWVAALIDAWSGRYLEGGP